MQVDLQDSSDCSDIITEDFEELEREPNVDDFVLVRFPKSIYYVAKILKEKNEDNEFYVSFFRKREKYNGFSMPECPDLALIPQDDIVLILPTPTPMKTKRLAGYLCFPISFGNLNVR